MVLADAPMLYLATNAGAAVFACLMLALGSQSRDPRRAFPAVAAISVAVLAASLFGPGVNNVHRWIALGPVRLHAASLVLPMLLVISPWLDRRAAFAAIAVAAVLVALQPDKASAAALCASSLVLLAFDRDRWSLFGFLTTAAALGISTSIPVSIPPVAFVEHVIGDASAIHPLLSSLMTISILIAVLAARAVSGAWTKSGAAWSACLVAYFLVSIAFPYPTPLLGYGISSILGFGLALALLVSLGEQKEDGGAKVELT